MIYVYQIGDYKTYGMVNINDKLYESNIKFKSKAEQAAWQPRKTFGFGGFNIEAGELSIEDMFIDTYEMRQYQQKAKLERLAMRPFVNVIAYMFVDPVPEEYDESETYSPNNTVLWLHTTGHITSLKPNYDGNVIGINMEIQPYWEPINRYLWQYNPMPLENSAAVTPNANPYNDLCAIPDATIIGSKVGYWNRRFYDDLLYTYDADTWEYWHTRLPDTYPVTGQGSGFLTLKNHDVTVPEMYGGVTRSMYQWKNLPTTGTMTMTVSSNIPDVGFQEYTNTINLATLNTALSDAGYTGIQSTDILVLGEYKSKQSFVIRSGAILSSVVPKWTYTGPVPGMIEHGYNTVDMSYPTTNIEMAYLHSFRMM